MFPLDAQPVAHCSITRTSARVGFGSRSKLPTPKYTPPYAASRSRRWVRGDVHVACVTSRRRPSTPTASGELRGGSERPGVAPVQLRHNDCTSQKPLTLLRGVTCHVTRPLAFSNV